MITERRIKVIKLCLTRKDGHVMFKKLDLQFNLKRVISCGSCSQINLWLYDLCFVRLVQFGISSYENMIGRLCSEYTNLCMTYF